MKLKDVMDRLCECTLKVELANDPYNVIYSDLVGDPEKDWNILYNYFGDKEVLKMIGGIDIMTEKPYLSCVIAMPSNEYNDWYEKYTNDEI